MIAAVVDLRFGILLKNVEHLLKPTFVAISNIKMKSLSAAGRYLSAQKYLLSGFGSLVSFALMTTLLVGEGGNDIGGTRASTGGKGGSDGGDSDPLSLKDFSSESSVE